MLGANSFLHLGQILIPATLVSFSDPLLGRLIFLKHLLVSPGKKLSISCVNLRHVVSEIVYSVSVHLLGLSQLYWGPSRTFEIQNSAGSCRLTQVLLLEMLLFEFLYRRKPFVRLKRKGLAMGKVLTSVRLLVKDLKSFISLLYLTRI